MTATTYSATDPTKLLPSESLGEGLLERLQEAFQQDFAVIDTASGSLEHVTSDWPRVDVFRWLGLLEHVARTGRAEVIEDHAPLVLLAVPLPSEEPGTWRVAIAVLLTQDTPSERSVHSAARAFGVDPAVLESWAVGRKAWPTHVVLPLAQSLADLESSTQAAKLAKTGLSEVSSQLLATFEELNLLHELTERLSLGESEQELISLSVERLAAVVPSDCVVGYFCDGKSCQATASGGKPPLRPDGYSEFFGRLGPQAERRTLVLNDNRTSSPTWAYPEVRQVVTAPILSNDRVTGWVAALNYRPPRDGIDERGFGAVEASLLSSVATLIGVHAGNRELFKQRAEQFEGAVHALSSTIDAKDSYTYGHSDRVARIAVRLAQELGCEGEDLDTVYLGGLLHDIGKIGVDDKVLRKPGELTEEEYAQIKTHPVLGEQILREAPQFAHVIPIVLHHHEQWDGKGYPDGLKGERTPLLARIASVADAVDAMGSDRPYRLGMPRERFEAILRDGAGTQWDPRVVDAYFAAQEDIREICGIDREQRDLCVDRWAPKA